MSRRHEAKYVEIWFPESGAVGILVLGLAINEKQRLRNFIQILEVFSHNTLQECFCSDIFSGGPHNPLPGS